jgi:predicted NAD/FAD-binding protein
MADINDNDEFKPRLISTTTTTADDGRTMITKCYERQTKGGKIRKQNVKYYVKDGRKEYIKRITEDIKNERVEVKKMVNKLTLAQMQTVKQIMNALITQ